MMKSNSKRIFIGIKIEPEGSLIRMISTLRSLLASERIKWVDPVNIHITLAFIGDTEMDRINTLALTLRNICGEFRKFSFSLTGTGLFRTYNDPRIIWTGIDNVNEVTRLNSLINNGLNELGYNIEEKPFNPHITLGRIKSLRDKHLLSSVLERYRNVIFQTVRAEEVILFESILRPEGPEYRPVEVFSLK